MVALFFFMAFINTIVDSLANSLVITAVGGGTEVLPFLTVYAVLPCSFIFLVLYSFATQCFSRAVLFNIVISVFMVFFVGFAALYPSHETIHFHGFATDALQVIPSGLAGAIGMIRNWMFTLFYCASELWGDVVLSLLFWGLANETTQLEDAALLYPLFGVGANLAQTLAGKLLSMFSNTAGSHMSYAQQLQIMMGVVLLFGGIALVFLAKSPQIRCLALMALAQGISTNLIDIAWKNHLHMLHPTPGAYAAFMGDVAMWTGIVTGSLMFCSPILFDRLGWKGVANATPTFMLWTGLPFFVGCTAYALWFKGGGLGAMATLRILVLAGAVLQVFAKGAKFSMFKPAEEMVYIRLDEESRTKGKAAIDVVGAQTGKSVGSVLQQVLLLCSGGTMSGTLPVMALAYFIMLRAWQGAVNSLAPMLPSSAADLHTIEQSGSDEDADDPEDHPADLGNGASPMQHTAPVLSLEPRT
ncbi:hypothetical protein WJX72_006395 [[Myrmecia] bisecta]|uniref:ADP,ATP carrier protein n=1 Tax=[Myrmecia] bisecta TaxID=41462 RepID=A0AAW1R7C0_9CHLO